MAEFDRTISAHPAVVNPLDGTEVLLVNQAGVTGKTTAQAIADLGAAASIPDGSITTPKFAAGAKAPLAGTADLATEATHAADADTADSATTAGSATTAIAASTAALATAVDTDGVDTNAIQDGAVTTPKIADHAVTGDKIDVDSVLAALCLCVPYGCSNLLSSSNPSANDAPYVSRTGCMYVMGQGNVAFKINSRTGVVTALAPSTLTGGGRGGAIYLGDTLHKVLFFGGAGGFITMDVDTDVFDTVVAPTAWGQLAAVYHAASGYVYYEASDKPRRCLVDGTSNSAGDTVTAAGRLCLVGDLLFVADDVGVGASKVWKYDLASWPTKGAAITLGGDMALIGGLAAHTGLGYLLVGDYDGALLVVNPTTLATVATITLSGVAARKTEHVVYDETIDRIYALDNAGKVWVIDGTSFAVLGYCLPVGGVSVTAFTSAGLTYDADLGLLSVRVNTSTEVHRFRA